MPEKRGTIIKENPIGKSPLSRLEDGVKKYFKAVEPKIQQNEAAVDRERQRQICQNGWS